MSENVQRQHLEGDAGTGSLYLVIIVTCVSAVTFICSAFGRYCTKKMSYLANPKCPMTSSPDHHPLHCLQRCQCQLNLNQQCCQPLRQEFNNLPTIVQQSEGQREENVDNRRRRFQRNASAGTNRGGSSAFGFQFQASQGVGGGDSLSRLTDSGTFKRLGIGGGNSSDVKTLARQLENRNLSPIHQTPPG